MRRHQPTVKELNELAAAWGAFREDEVWYPRLADAIRVVLGLPKTAAQIAIETAGSTRIDRLSRTTRTFKFVPPTGASDAHADAQPPTEKPR